MRHRRLAVLLVCFLVAPVAVTGLALASDTTPAAARRALLLERQLAVWTDADYGVEEQQRMRAINPEWDFMARTFLVLSLANLAADDPKLRDEYLAIIHRILVDTLERGRQHGQAYFLLPYVRRGPFRSPGGRSLFVDGEIAVMLGARRLLLDSPRWRSVMQRRVGSIEHQLLTAPAHLAESYPNEGWLFCNTFALVALRMSEVLDGRDHAAVIRGWLRSARENLIDANTGLLVASFTYDGTPLDGPEGSSIWLSASNLLLVDEELAHDQYRRAVQELGAELLGYGFAREWPASWRGPTDIDSGPIIPGFDASASSSGFAILASRAFGDGEYHDRLVAALDLADVVLASDSALAEAADNAVAEAVILYGLSFGPLWQRIERLDAADVP